VSAVTVAFVGAMTHRCPWLLPLFAEHLGDQEGEVLPHLYMADVERWAEREVDRAPAKVSVELRELLDFIEAEFVQHLHSEIAEVISASFLEHLPRLGEGGAALRDLVGPTCAARLRLIG
jgi:hypothetical protein